MPSISREEHTTYRLLMSGGSERTLNMPKGWKITFGPNVPGGGRRSSPYERSPYQPFCFRVYDRNKNLKLCVPDVQEFWEEGTFTMEIIERDRESNLVTARVNMERPGQRRALNQERWAEPVVPAQPTWTPDPDMEEAGATLDDLRSEMRRVSGVSTGRMYSPEMEVLGQGTSPITGPGGGNEH